jgi:myosin-crossreactive antigen
LGWLEGPAQTPREESNMTEDTGKNLVDKTAEVTENVLKAVEAGQKAAIEAVRKFMDQVDEAIPEVGVSSEQRQAVIDAALDMADKLVTSQYNFLSSMVRNVESTLNKAEGEAK